MSDFMYVGGKNDDDARVRAFYLLKKYTGATNSEIGALFGGLSYSAVAKSFQFYSRKVALDHDLDKRIRKLLTVNSIFKG